MTNQNTAKQKVLAQLKAMWPKKIPIRATTEEQLTSNAPRLSATDLARMTVCQRKVYLKYHGDPAERVAVSPMQQIIQAQGIAHEEAVVDPGDFTKIPTKNLADGAIKTVEAMRCGAGKIYQGVLRSDELQGRPDLLVRIEKPSDLGDYRYCPVDIKSGRQLKHTHELQMMAYLYLLNQIQGVETTGIIQLGDNSQQSVTLTAEFDEWLQRAKVVSGGQVEPRPFIASYCNRCVWHQHCRGIAQRRQDISLISGVTRQVRSALRQEGISTLSDLAKVQPYNLLHIRGVGDKTSRMMVHRARAFLDNEAIHFGNLSLSNWPVEVYFDVESVQVGGFSQENIRYYLFGWCVRHNQSLTFEYEYELAEHPDQEAETWERFLERIDSIAGPVFHYSNYEKQTVNTLCSRYGTNPQAKRLQDRLTDLYPMITGNIALPLQSYSIKAVAPWLGYKWKGVTQTAADTMVEYSRWLKTSERTHLDNIVTYNEHDCRAMVVIKDWLAGFNLQTTIEW